jgi:Glutaredoxin-like domain (DUF836)
VTVPGGRPCSAAIAILYTRPGCPLCYTPRRTAAHASRRHGMILRVVDVSRDAALLQRFGNEVPLLQLPGGTVLQGRVAAERVQQAFREVAEGGSAGAGWGARLRAVLGLPPRAGRT